MSRRTGTSALDVHLNGRRVARWSVRRGIHALEYDAGWLAAPERRPLSLSLPLSEEGRPLRGEVVERWFENLLPDDPAMRERMRRRFGAASSSTMDLLAEVGRDCIGAVQLSSPDAEVSAPGPAMGDALDEADVATLLRDAATGAVPGRHDDAEFRISLAGAQEKTALTLIDGVWHRPTGTTPTTHILKLPLGRIAMEGVDLSWSIENEHLCLRLLAALGLPVANSMIARFGERSALVVERFDRRFGSDGRTLLRLPQEDLCQAFGLSREAKYEADGGPGIERAMTLLSGSRRAHDDRRTFFAAQLAFLLLAAVDGHAKNFSLFLERDARYTMTPLYDVLSVWPHVDSPSLPRRKVAFAMGWHGANRHYRLTEILPRHVRAMAARCAMGAELPAIIEGFESRMPTAMERVAQEVAGEVPDALRDSVFDGARGMLARLGAGLG